MDRLARGGDAIKERIYKLAEPREPPEQTGSDAHLFRGLEGGGRAGNRPWRKRQTADNFVELLSIQNVRPTKCSESQARGTHRHSTQTHRREGVEPQRQREDGTRTRE